MEEEKNDDVDSTTLKEMRDLMKEKRSVPNFQKEQGQNYNPKDKAYQKQLKKENKKNKQSKNNNNRDDEYYEKTKTKIDFNIEGQPIERRLKGNKYYHQNKNAEDRENNKKLNDIENNIKHRWINLVEKRGDQTIIPHKY